MNKYAQISIFAAEAIKNGETPILAWNNASCQIFEKGSASQTKGCPRNAFLGLYGINTESKNASYAIKALEHLQNNGDDITPKQLWHIIMNGEKKTHNSQMDIVLALHKNKYI